MSARRSCTIGGLALLAVLLPGRSTAIDYDVTLKGLAVGEFDGGQDLGLSNRPSNQQGYLDLTPWVHAQFSQSWSGLVRARVFAPTDAVLVAGNDNNNIGATSKAYIGMKEAWLDYRGLTSYPGESLRLGRQRMREDDAQWWDQDVDALRWIFDTSLLQMEIGAAHQFSSYRSDGAPLPPAQKDRTYEFATMSIDRPPGVRLGLRVAHADDQAHALDIGAPPPSDGKRITGHQTWFGAFVDNRAFDIDNAPDFCWWGSATGLLGNRHRLATTRDAAGAVTVAGDTPEAVRAWSADAGLRYRLPMPAPVQFGAAYSYSTGGNAGYRDDQFEQTGIQSNYSRFTGTRTLIHRYNEDYRAELGNLQVATVFVSTDYGQWDASAVASHFRRVHGDGPVVSDGISVAPVTTAKTLGNGYDVVVTRYFGERKPVDRYEPSDSSQSSVRLRAAVFDPGRAYGPARSTDYRVTLELTLWY